jgi:hypothetical protein
MTNEDVTLYPSLADPFSFRPLSRLISLKTNSLFSIVSKWATLFDSRRLHHVLMKKPHYFRGFSFLRDPIFCFPRGGRQGCHKFMSFYPFPSRTTKYGPHK